MRIGILATGIGLGMLALGASIGSAYGGSAPVDGPNPVAAQTQPTTAPSTRPIGAHVQDAAAIRQLIQQMGDERYPVRAAADQALREMGPAILPLLEEARKQQQPPEIDLRLASIIHHDWDAMGKPSPSLQWLARHPAAPRDLVAGQGAGHVEIHEDFDGIDMTYGTPDDAHHAAATDRAQLQKNDPQAFTAYWHMFGPADAPNVPIGPATLQHGSKDAKAKSAPIANPDQVMRDELKDPALNESQRQKIRAEIQRADGARPSDGSANLQ